MLGRPATELTLAQLARVDRRAEARELVERATWLLVGLPVRVRYPRRWRVSVSL